MGRHRANGIGIDFCGECKVLETRQESILSLLRVLLILSESVLTMFIVGARKMLG